VRWWKNWAFKLKYFATVRRRTNSTSGRCTKKRHAMVYKLAMAAQKNWRRLNKYPFLEMVQGGRGV